MSLVEGCWALTGLRVLVEGWIFGRTKASSHLLAQTFWAWGPDFEPCEITWPESLVYIVLMYKIVQILFVLVPLNLRETKIAHSPCPPRLATDSLAHVSLGTPVPLATGLRGVRGPFALVAVRRAPPGKEQVGRIWVSLVARYARPISERISCDPMGRLQFALEVGDHIASALDPGERVSTCFVLKGLSGTLQADFGTNGVCQLRLLLAAWSFSHRSDEGCGLPVIFASTKDSH